MSVLALGLPDFLYALPLILAIGFVYAATRDEKMSRILANAIRIVLWTIGSMAAIFLFMVVVF
ncbi:MAG: hypothetical protein Q4D98_11930 [Planctomycetia bacterium]|nr:hypothetical protein [Planctomycetia bacterium]